MTASLSRSAITMTAPPDPADAAAWDEVRRRLIAFAHRRMDGAAIDGRGPEDLAQEAIARHLEGGRQRPDGVALVPFLCGVVQSLVSHARGRSIVTDLGHEPPAKDVDLVAEAEVLRAAWRRVRQAVRDDVDAGVLLDALVEHWPERDLPDIASVLGWSPAELRRVWRRITYRVRQRTGGLER